MSLSNSDLQKALRIKRAINEYFESSSETKVQAKQLMEFFKSNGVFSSKNKDGLTFLVQACPD